MHACPALAYTLDGRTGAVILDEDKCIGCKYCSWACPYDAPVFDDGRGVMRKCTFCNHRLADGLKPACAALCPTGALDFADILEDEIANDIDGFPASGLGPHIDIVPLRKGRSLPVMTAPQVAEPVPPPDTTSPSDITLRSEWSLAVFTLSAASLVAAFAGRVLESIALDPIAFVVGTAVTMGLATLHLGKKTRAYRAILNLRRSWLSREVASLSTFFALATAYLWLSPGESGLGWLAALAGLLALLSTDYVYKVVRTSHPLAHSASVLLTGVLFTGVFSGVAWLAALAGFAKLALYVLRKLHFINERQPVRPIVSAARTALGLVLPPLLWLIDFETYHVIIMASVVAGEVIDRCEFYAELQRRAPRHQLAADLEKRTGQTDLTHVFVE
jgi:DMSO reductase anchor subunit/ferredoxin